MLPKQLFRHFLSSIFQARSRQKLLVLAAFGLAISSFSLITLQGVMGGLQRNLILRSKAVLGHGHFIVDHLSLDQAVQLQDYFNAQNVPARLEYEIELLARSGAALVPVVAHGIGWKESMQPQILNGHRRGLVIPYDLAMKLKVGEGEQINLIAPGVVDSLLGDTLRMISLSVSGLVASDVPEVDALHVWPPIESIWNLIKLKKYNRLGLFDLSANFNLEKFQHTGPEFARGLRYISWEEQNSALMYALRLETTVMAFLFASMTILISLCIVAGVHIYLDKIKVDLTALWILGASERTIQKLYRNFFGVFGPIFIVLGMVLGLLFLKILDSSSLEIMPAVFVERKIPIHYGPWAVIIGLTLPCLIYLLLVSWSLLQFKKLNFLEYLRSVGR
ncbi:MAG: hypothetical protein A2X86_21035 [Bdellovibrionales bacterium GWA2_49_15]|nr:MAG: hypothetical protein A2X86_21035 [Bdellovibrionales bacterium GWA2_49_15]HAZ14864.1 hypothetical protein [Bdellovibrionales bacterium]